ncbi:UvrD-helicase domain-containing protein [Bacillus massiliigorillae]|uniref:UvrD-helicase domain-containing protein n=1 Tax=Bacillus massiliigorillae TaxID=1243664 RepID=UPI0003A76490|nr:UvrD-helicase domain-containing protein [Bacillus massiliigorillae]
MTKVIVDIESRSKITEVLQKNFLVEAGAGSGKTTSLVQRMVQLIYTGTCKIEEIVAITFTRKAAEELKSRFQIELEKAWKQERNTHVQHLLETAIQNMDQCFLGTVHAFCARLLRERPIEAQLDITFSALEEEDDTLLAQSVFYHYVQTLSGIEHPILKRIHELGIDDQTLLERFQEVKRYPDVLWVAESLERPDLTGSYQTFLVLLQEANRCIPDDIQGGPDHLQKSIQEALRKAQYRSNSNQLIMEIFELFDKKTVYKIVQKNWTSKEDAKEYQAKIKQYFEDCIIPALQAWREYSHSIIIEFLYMVLKQYEAIKKEQSLMNFQDLLMKVAELLKYNSEVRLYFQDKYRYLLVDEFQDTDPIQAEMMFYLTSEDVNEQNWMKCKPRQGSLFVVGDPKQAIYRFRRADISIYNRVKELILQHGGEVLQLTMNFRTVSAVTNSLNDVFIQHLPEKETQYQAAFRSLDAYYVKDNESIVGIKKLVVQKEYCQNQSSILQKDAENIAQYIRQCMQEGHQPSEFMILTRYNAGIDVYAQCLEEYEIPIVVSGERALDTTQEFNELLILLRALVDPTDAIATVAALRSVCFGINDEELYQWKQANGIFSIYASEAAEIEFEHHPVYVALKKLRYFATLKNRFSPVVAIRKILEDVGFYPLLVERGYGQREYTQVLQVIEALRRQEDIGNTTFYQAVQFLQKFISKNSSIVNIIGNQNAVRIMNVHKAKGLEAPIVFLANPGKKTDIAERISIHISRDEEYTNGYFLIKKQNGFSQKTIAQPKNWEASKEEENVYLSEEESRIIYVAATRAEKALIISACEEKNKKNPWNILLEGLNDVEEIQLNDVEEEERVQVNKNDKITQAIFQNEVGTVKGWISASSLPSYIKYSPTDGKEELFMIEVDREDGGGKKWGTAIHEVFEKLVKGQLTDENIDSILRKYDLSVDRKDEVINIVEQFKKSPVWPELQRAEQTLTEVPFSLFVNVDDPVYSMVQSDQDVSVPVMLNGIIDLAYKVDGKWKIIDYKTDRPKEYDSYNELTKYYFNQISIYFQVWQNIVNEEVDSASLYFVTANEYRAVL